MSTQTEVNPTRSVPVHLNVPMKSVIPVLVRVLRLTPVPTRANLTDGEPGNGPVPVSCIEVFLDVAILFLTPRSTSAFRTLGIQSE
jgi:hypothetical protein